MSFLSDTIYTFNLKHMLIYYRPYTDPFLNIAAEDYYVKHAISDMCMIWINEPSVIIGKHQNAYAEINYPFVREKKIPVIRRISGGGAVYHDTGNVNFSFIGKTTKPIQVDFGKFTSIIVNFMQNLGIVVNVGKRNSLFIGDQKFSGHAEHLFHDKVLHHGTILINSDLLTLQNSITPLKEYKGKALASVRSEVINIAPHLPYGIDIQLFVENFIKWLLDFFPGSQIYNPGKNEQHDIKMLSETKYKTWEWNFGYSPAYTFQVHIQAVAGIIEANIKVENGMFASVEVTSESTNSILHKLLISMTGILHKEEEIHKFVENNLKSLELAGVNTVLFKEGFFR